MKGGEHIYMSALKSSVHTVSTELSVNGWHVGTVIIASVPFPTLLDYHHFRHHLCRYSKYCPCVYLLRYYEDLIGSMDLVQLRRESRVSLFLQRNGAILYCSCYHMWRVRYERGSQHVFAVLCLCTRLHSTTAWWNVVSCCS